MDALEEVLRAIKLDSAVYFRGEFSSPWSVENPASDRIAEYLTSKPGHVIVFHAILKGTAFVKVGRDPANEVSAAKIVIFPHGDSHTLGNGASSRSAKAIQLLKRHVKGQVSVARLGGGGETTSFVCGFLVCEPRLSQVLLAGLPRVLIIPIGSGLAGDWIQNSIRFLVYKKFSSDMGAELVSAKLSEVLFLETIRNYIHELSPDQRGWLAGIRDPFVGKALAELHKRPGYSWNLVELGRQVGMSRTRLVERFSQFVGEPPMAYLTRWRLRLGAQLLLSSDKSIAEIACDVGYKSEASFGRAFKKEFSKPPARFRRSERASA